MNILLKQVILLDFTRILLYNIMVEMRIWRNRQTRQIQVLVVAIPCVFKSHYPHHAE